MKLTLMLFVVMAFLGSKEIFATGISDDSLLGIGAGISSPSVTDAISDNPAGLALNRRMKFLGAASAEDKSFNPFSGTGRLLFGTGRIGAGMGVHTYKRGSEDRLAADYGVAAYADSFKSMIGVGGSTVLKKEDRSGDSHQINLGILTNPYGGARIGAGLVGILGGIDYITFGSAMDLASGTTLTVDFASNRHFEGRSIEPALGYRFADFAFQAGYGFHFDNKATSYIRKGFTAGINLYLSKDFSLEGVYNHHSKYYVALTATL